jgi:Bacterial pre-peptidase C-terminal domain
MNQPTWEHPMMPFLKSSIVNRQSSIVIAFLVLTATAGAQLRPPTVTSVVPPGVQRGMTFTLTVEGANLANASAIQFSHTGIAGEITNIIELPYQPVVRPRGATAAPIEDLFALHRLLVKVHVDETVPAGRYNFRIKTPLGSTNTGSFYVGSLIEIFEAEPNSPPAEAHKIFYPSTVVGTITRSGDDDVFEFDVEAGKTLVFEVQAATIGSILDSELTLIDSQATVLARNKDFSGRPDSFLSYTFANAGTYRIRIADAIGGGSARHNYRLNIGALPYLSKVFPLGLRQASSAELQLEGVNLDNLAKLKVSAPAASDYGQTLTVQPSVRGRESLNAMRVAIGEHPEISEQEDNNTPAKAQPVTLPVCINGRIDGGQGSADKDIFRFTAKKGERVSMTVLANRLGSPLDSILEVFDSAGSAVPRIVARPVWQTFITLNDPDSLRRGVRIDSWAPLGIGDYLMVGNELVQVEELPKNPDDDIKLRSYRGSRIAYEGTTPQTHAMNTPVYKVELRKPGDTFAPNGMPLFPIHYRNDDGGQNLGKDSWLMFEAPSNGDYFVRIRDVRNSQGNDYAYRLTVAAPKPDFTLTVDPKNPNIPRGDAVPVTVTVTRSDGFDGSVDVEILDLPEGITATPGRILPGATNATLILRSTADVKLPERLMPFRVKGKAIVDGRVREHWGDNSSLTDDSVSGLSVSEPPELLVTSAEPKEIVLEPGQQAAVTVSIARQRGFSGRVPVEVRNLPLGVIVPDIGLNGILITESETSRVFHIQADPRTGPLEQTLYLVGRIETNSPNSTEHASTAIRLKIIPKSTQVSQK